MQAPSLATYARRLIPGEDSWNLRLLLHEFGLVWQSAAAKDQLALIAAEPSPTGDRHWDAFLAAYAEHLAYHADLESPAWTTRPQRYLDTVWFPVMADLATLRVEAIVHAPAHFDAHGVLIARRELEVV